MTKRLLDVRPTSDDFLSLCVLADVGDTAREDPTSELYTWFYLAQHYDHLRQYSTALDYINRCLHHTSTFIEAQAVKGQIYKVCLCVRVLTRLCRRLLHTIMY